MPNVIYINIWDDFADDDESGKTSDTHVQIEAQDDLELHEQKEILLEYFPFIQENIPGIKVSLYLYDTMALYPDMDYEACKRTGFRHYKAYQLKIEGITHEPLDNFIEQVRGKEFDYHGNKVFFISES